MRAQTLAHQALHAWRQHCSFHFVKAASLTCAAYLQGHLKIPKLRRYLQTVTVQRAWRKQRLGRRAKQTPRPATGAGLEACRQFAVFRRWACTTCERLFCSSSTCIQVGPQCAASAQATLHLEGGLITAACTCTGTVSADAVCRRWAALYITCCMCILIAEYVGAASHTSGMCMRKRGQAYSLIVCMLDIGLLALRMLGGSGSASRGRHELGPEAVGTHCTSSHHSHRWLWATYQHLKYLQGLQAVCCVCKVCPCIAVCKPFLDQ